MEWGKAKLQAELGLNTKAEAEKLFNQYHDNVPFVKELMNKTSQFAQTSDQLEHYLAVVVDLINGNLRHLVCIQQCRLKKLKELMDVEELEEL
jgi:hypothetical protein